MSNDHVNTLLGKNLIPIVKHSSPWYKFLQNECSKAATGLLPGRKVKLFVVKSSRRNAYTFPAGGYYYVTVTEGLISHIEKSTTALLGTEDVRQFLRDWLGVGYPADQGDKAWRATFDESLQWALRFALLHELAHIELGHADGTSPELPEDIYQRTVQTLELITYGGDGDNRFDRYNEYCADREGACWLTQLAIRKASEKTGHGTSRLGLAFFGTLVTILHVSRHVAATREIDETFTHQSFEARLEGIWEGVNLVLDDQLTPHSVGFMQSMMTALRAMVENLVLGAPSYYWISL